LAVSVLEPAAEIDFEKEKLSMLRLTTCGLTILFAFAPAARAVDGIVLINQSTITNGLTGCPTGGHFPIVICQSGSYRLSGNLTVPDANTDAIHITADNVTLDLNGFAILGPVTCKLGTLPVQCSTTGSGVGITSVHSNNIALSNGAINGMGRAGIYLTGFFPNGNGNGARIDGLRVANNADPAYGGIVADAQYEGVIISNCTITTNAGSGILAPSGTVNLNTVSYNGGVGINGGLGIVSGVVGLVASNNLVDANGQDGMRDVGLAVHNIIRRNVGFGFSCHQGNPIGETCNFEGNVFLFNQGGTSNNSLSLGQNSSNGGVF
jgi:hypothetical protein